MIEMPDATIYRDDAERHTKIAEAFESGDAPTELGRIRTSPWCL